MKIECTVEEFKKLIKNTPVAVTTDAKNFYDKNYVEGSICLEQLK